MKLGDAGSATRSVLVDRPAAILPAYLAGTSVALVAQSIPLVGIALAFVALLGTGRIDRFVSTVQSVDVSPTGGMSDAAAERLSDAALALLTPTTVALLLASALGGLVAFLVARAFVGAAQVHTVVAALENERPVVAGVRGAGADGWTFLAFGIVRAIALLTPTAAVAVVAVVAAEGALLPVLALAVLLWLPVTVGVYVLLAFAPQAIVVDGTGVVGGIERGAGFVRRNPGRVGAYFVVVFVLVATAGGAAFAFQVLGVGPLAQVVAAFGLAPTLGVLKTALYLDADEVVVGDTGTVPVESGEAVAAGEDRESLAAVEGEREATWREREQVDERETTGENEPRDERETTWDDGESGDERAARDERTVGDETGALGSIAGALRRGGHELLGFVRSRIGLVVAALGLFAAGVAGGVVVARPYAVPFEGSPATNVFGTFPVDTFVSLTANNWLVSISTAYAGLGFGVPPAVNMLFNGALVGGVVGLGTDPLAVAALVVPHGVIEIPALAISGALGLHLGGAAWSYVRGRTSADDLASELVRTYYALLGLLPLFVVAAFVEAFVTWWVAGLVV